MAVAISRLKFSFNSLNIPGFKGSDNLTTRIGVAPLLFSSTLKPVAIKAFFKAVCSLKFPEIRKCRPGVVLSVAPIISISKPSVCPINSYTLASNFLNSPRAASLVVNLAVLLCLAATCKAWVFWSRLSFAAVFEARYSV